MVFRVTSYFAGRWPWDVVERKAKGQKTDKLEICALERNMRYVSNRRGTRELKNLSARTEARHIPEINGVKCNVELLLSP